MKKLFFILLILLSHGFIAAQSAKPDTLKGKHAISVGLGNHVKAELGTTYLAVAYHPNRHLDFYVAPSWGIFTGGTAIFAGSKINLFSNHRLYTNFDLTYRHSSRTTVNYENDDTGGQESYYIPPSDYFVAGFGLNFRNPTENGLMVFNLTATYNEILGKQTFEYRQGPFSKNGEDGAARKLAGGWGFTLSFVTQIWGDKKKK